MRKTVTRITDGARLPSYIPPRKIHLLGKRGTRYDLDIGPNGRPALYDHRHAICAVDDLPPSLRRQPAPARDRRTGPLQTCRRTLGENWALTGCTFSGFLTRIEFVVARLNQSARPRD